METFALHNADRAVRCPGSLQLTPRVIMEQDDNTTRLEGKTADWLISRLRVGDVVTENEPGPYGVPVTRDMLDHVLGYFNHIRQVLHDEGILYAPKDTINPDWMCNGGFEQTVDLSWLTAAYRDVPGIHGRSDYRYHYGIGRKLLVWDFKYGHRPVEAVDNAQLMGSVLDAKTRRNTDSARLFIYQPRSMDGVGPAKEWAVSEPDIAHWQERFITARLDSMKPDAPLNTGGHCRYCKARGLCPELNEEINMLKTVLDAPPSLTPADVGQRLTTAAELAEKSGYLKDALTTQGLTMVKSGQHVPGFKIVRSITRRTLKDADTLRDTAILLGVPESDIFEQKPKPLGALEKALSSDILGELTDKPPGRLELVPESDKRQAAINTDAATVFAAPIKA